MLKCPRCKTEFEAHPFKDYQDLEFRYQRDKTKIKCTKCSAALISTELSFNSFEYKINGIKLILAILLFAIMKYSIGAGLVYLFFLMINVHRLSKIIFIKSIELEEE